MNRVMRGAVIAVIAVIGFGGFIQAQDRTGDDLVSLIAEMAELRSRIAVLEARAEESDKRLATQADVEAVRSDVREGFAGIRADVVWLKWVLSISGGLVVFLGGWIVKLLRAGGGGQGLSPA